MTSRWNRIRKNFDDYAQIAAIGRAFQTGQLSAVEASGAIARMENAPRVPDVVTVDSSALVTARRGSALAVG